MIKFSQKFAAAAFLGQWPKAALPSAAAIGRVHLESIIKIRPLCLCIAIVLLASGCTRTIVDEYQRVSNASVDEAYVRPGADFSKYSRLRFQPLEIYFPEGQGAPDPAALERIREIFRSAFVQVIGDDYPIVEEAGRDVLGVRVSLVDLKSVTDLSQVPVKGRLASLVAKGELSLFIEFTDSSSGQVLARAADREKGAEEFTLVNPDQAWVDTEVAAQRWAALFRDFLDKNLTRP